MDYYVLKVIADSIPSLDEFLKAWIILIVGFLLGFGVIAILGIYFYILD